MGRLKQWLHDFFNGESPSTADRVLTEHGPIVRGLRRFKVFVGAAIVVLALGNGLALQSMKTQRAESCKIRNAQIVAQNEGAERSRMFLGDVESAMRQDGLKHTASELSAYIEQAEQAPRLAPIKC